MQRVLVVEDSQTMREWIAAVLEEIEPPLQVDLAASGFEALRLLPRHQYDLIVTDINMPDIQRARAGFVRAQRRASRPDAARDRFDREQRARSRAAASRSARTRTS